jgi:TolB protein
MSIDVGWLMKAFFVRYENPVPPPPLRRIALIPGWCLLLLILLTLLCCAQSLSGEHRPSAKIVFVHSTSGLSMMSHSDVYVIDSDGSHLQQLTNDGHSRGPKWSANGRRVAFISDDDQVAGIFTMDPEGTHSVQLFKSKGQISSLAWAPDGRRIAFDFVPSGNVARGHTDIYSIDVISPAAPRLLVKDGESPAWSPDGKAIAFSSNRGKYTEILAANIDGSETRQLTNDKSEHAMPAWSSDGTKIAFVSNASGNYQIYAMKADGSDIKQLTSGKKVDCWAPSWSQDGKGIACHCRSKRAEPEIFVLEEDGANSLVRRVTRDGGAMPDFRKTAAGEY